MCVHMHVCLYLFFMVVPFGSQRIRTDPEERRDETRLAARLGLCVLSNC